MKCWTNFNWRRAPDLCLSIVILGTGIATAQNYPTKPLRIITAAPGGSADVAARIIAQGLAAAWGQQAVVENHGGSVVVSAEPVAKAAPDGHTLLFYGNAIWTEPLMRESTPYDALRDLAPVTLAASSPNVLAAHPSVPANSIKELIALAKKRPGQLNYATSGSGGSSHLAAELFKSMAHINMVRIPYRGTGPAVIDLVAGQVQLMFANPTVVDPHVKRGKLKSLAVTSAQPSKLAPGLPTIASAGLKGYEAISILCLLAPAKTPPAIINQLNREVVRILNVPATKELLFNAGIEVVASTPEQLLAAMKAEILSMAKVIKEANIRAE